MAKKSRRASKKDHSVRLSPAQMVQPGTAETPSASPTIRARSAMQAPDLQEEYRYVITDLKRIGVIAAAMLVVLVALALFLT
jgi:hypothetical protein